MGYLLWSFIILLALSAIHTPTESCTCMPTHPQEDFCKSDFVILATVKKEIKNIPELSKSYKVKIRKVFKTNEKARLALKHNRLMSAMEESMCGVDLQVRRTFVISGRVYGGHAHISLCGTARPWPEVGHRQRKGYRLLFSRGCDCRVRSHFGSKSRKNNEDGQCNWKIGSSCQQQHGICLRNGAGVCNWTKSLALKRCLYGNDHGLWPKKKQEMSPPDPFRLPQANITMVTSKQHDHRNKEDESPKTTYYHYNQISN